MRIADEALRQHLSMPDTRQLTVVGRIIGPGEGRVRNARQFQVWEGGGEYNVARGLSSTFGHATAVLTALPRNELGLLAQQLIQAGGVDSSQILWREYDGIGRNTRMGLNFTERGFGVRAPLGVSDRAY